MNNQLRKGLHFFCMVTLFFVCIIAKTYSVSAIEGTIYETESNNTAATANQTYDDYDSKGAISLSSDIDWWKVQFYASGSANFFLGNIPANCNYDMRIYKNGGSTLIASSTNSGTSSELVTMNVEPGIVYYVKITTSSGYSSSRYSFRAKNYPDGDSYLQGGNYYINNINTGKYLTRNGSTVKGESGRISGIGSRINWNVTRVNGTNSLIRINSSSNIYLCSDTAGNISYTQTGGATNYCLWDIQNTSRGYTIKNVGTGKYLYVVGDTLLSSTTLATSAYWRTVKTSEYGNGSSYTYSELTGITANNVNVKYQGSASYSYQKLSANNNLLWADSSDFTITMSRPNFVNINSNTLTGIDLGTVTITVKHKVTGISSSFVVTVHCDSALLGIDVGESGHDHYSALLNAKADMEANGYSSNYYVYSSDYPSDKINNMIKYSSLFVCRTHGEADRLQRSINGDFYYAMLLHNFSNGNTVTQLDFKDNIVVFSACETAYGNQSISQAALEAGAKVVVGFERPIYCDKASDWVKLLVKNLLRGETVSDAASSAENQVVPKLARVFYDETGISSYKVIGNGQERL